MNSLVLLILAAVVSHANGTAPAGAHPADAAAKRESIRGAEQVSAKERERQREEMRRARSAGEQSKVPDERVRQMRERAAAQGLRVAGDAR